MSTHESKSNSNFRILLNGVRGYLNFKVVSILICLSILIVGFIFSAIIPPKYTEITDIADYGIYSGTCADSFVNKYITSFSPKKLVPLFIISVIHIRQKTRILTDSRHIWNLQLKMKQSFTIMFPR